MCCPLPGAGNGRIKIGGTRETRRTGTGKVWQKSQQNLSPDDMSLKSSMTTSPQSSRGLIAAVTYKKLPLKQLQFKYLCEDITLFFRLKQSKKYEIFLNKRLKSGTLKDALI